MNVLLWHVHGAYTRAFVHGRHRYLLPTTTPRDAWGLGVPADVEWPAAAVEVHVEDLVDTEVDVVVAQRPQELDLAERLLGRRLGRDVALVYLEHNTPGQDVPFTRHPMADRDDLVLVHVTHHNALMWDTGRTRTTVVRHGLPDPGVTWSPAVPRLAVVVNEPLRRGRAVGADLIPRFTPLAGVDLFGMKVTGAATALGVDEAALATFEDLPQQRMHEELAQRGAYLHLNRWTSLGLSLVEAMLIGMPVVVLATSEAGWLIPHEAGAVSPDVDQLARSARELLDDLDLAAAAGQVSRQVAQELFGLPRFLDDWDAVLDGAVTTHGARRQT